MQLKEKSYPVDSRGKPDLTFYTDSAEYYARMHEQYVATVQGQTGPGHEPELAFARRAHASWGLIAKGAAAIPFALTMLRSAEADAREDGAAILAEMGKGESVVDAILSSLAAETDIVARDALVTALGAMRSKRAVPYIAAIIKDESQDSDSRWNAAESLGRIARRRFHKQDNPVQAALDWLNKHEKPADRSRGS